MAKDTISETIFDIQERVFEIAPTTDTERALLNDIWLLIGIVKGLSVSVPSQSDPNVRILDRKGN